MPITVACSCGAKLRAPDSAAGKRVKCPKCGDPVPVPAAEADFEVIDDDPPPAPAKKKPTVAAAVKRRPEPVEVDEPVDDDEEKPKKKSRERDDEDDKPKKKGGKRRTGKNREEEKKKRLIRLILGIVGAVTVLGAMVGVIVVVVSMINNDPAKTGLPAQPTPPALPSGWSTFKGDGFSVAVPDAVQFKSIPTQARADGVKAQKTWGNGVTGPDVTAYVVGFTTLDAAVIAQFEKDRELSWNQFVTGIMLTGGYKLQKQSTISTPFGEGRQIVFTAGQAGEGRGVLRMGLKGQDVVIWMVIGRGLAGEDASEAKPFFDTFKVE